MINARSHGRQYSCVNNLALASRKQSSQVRAQINNKNLSHLEGSSFSDINDTLHMDITSSTDAIPMSFLSLHTERFVTHSIMCTSEPQANPSCSHCIGVVQLARAHCYLLSLFPNTTTAIALTQAAVAVVNGRARVLLNISGRPQSILSVLLQEGRFRDDLPLGFQLSGSLVIVL